MHTSNRYLNLEPVVRGAAERLKLKMVRLRSQRDAKRAIYAAEWIILTRNEVLLSSLAQFADQADESLMPAIRWTDNRSNLLEVIKD